MKIIDLTRIYENGQTAGSPKNHPTVELRRMARAEQVGFNTSSILLGSHIGTHMDAPRHFIPDGKTIEYADIPACIGGVTVADLTRIGPGGTVTREDAEAMPLSERMLFVFGWERYEKEPAYSDKWPRFSLEAAEYLMEHGVRMMPMDPPAPDGKSRGTADDFEVHRSLLQREMIFVESLANTSAVDLEREYIIIALPLRLRGLDGSPCRVVLIEKQPGMFEQDIR